MPSDVSRRQNSSCDSCRRSKRRCVVPNGDAASKSPKSCSYCTHLGRNCTFRFVAAHAMQRRRASALASPSVTIGHQLQMRPVESSILDFDLLPADLSFLQPFENLPILNTAPIITAGSTAESDDQFLDRLPPELADLADIFSAWSQHSGPPLPAYNDLPTLSRMHSETPPQKPLHCPPPVKFSLGQAPPSCPIDLLNTALGSDEVESELVNVYDTVFGRCASRFLSCRNNIFSGSSHYCFDHELRQSPARSKVDITPSSLLLLNESTLNESISEPHANTELEATRVTLIGIARFLDNFGGLFGNPLTKTEQTNQERTLATICKAFALQWKPLSSVHGEITSTEKFAAAWREAHDRLTRLKYTKSFRRIFAVLLFQMTSRPQNLSTATQDRTSPQTLLNCALRELQHLAECVRRYCEELPLTSRYRKLLEISLSAIQWWAYLRDTSTSISTDRSCILPYPPCGEGGFSNWCNVDNKISSPIGLCEHETGELLYFYRHVIGFRFILEQSSLTSMESNSSLTTAVGKCTEVIGNTSAKYMRWLSNLESGHPRLSREAQASSSLLLMFWSLGVLCFVEQLDTVMNSWSRLNPEFPSKRTAYCSIAVSCMIRTARVVEEAKLHRIFDENIEIRTDDPGHCLIHASSEFVVTALVKGIRHALAMNAAGQSVLEISVFGSDNCTVASLPLSVAPLVALLSGMTETVSGSLSAAVALHELVQEFGDALMDCCI
jgi:hypothetical protein